MDLERLRRNYQSQVCGQIIGCRKEIPTIADSASPISVCLSHSLLTRMGFALSLDSLTRQEADNRFIVLTHGYMLEAFDLLKHLRPGNRVFLLGEDSIRFDQHESLSELASVYYQDSLLRTTLADYLLIPDILVGRYPVSDQEIGLSVTGPKNRVATLTPLRASNFISPKPILYAGVSCRLTIRSDRSQNSRTEALNLIRNRKGNTPHIVIVTAEPLPSRIASVALGTGDLDCVYHMALYELQEAINEVGDETLSDTLNLLVAGKRLRDISDLPFDLAI